MRQKLSPEAAENKRQYIAAYNKERYERVSLALSHEQKARWQKEAAANGKSLRAYIIDAVEGGI